MFRVKRTGWRVQVRSSGGKRNTLATFKKSYRDTPEFTECTSGLGVPAGEMKRGGDTYDNIVLGFRAMDGKALFEGKSAGGGRPGASSASRATAAPHGPGV